MTKRQKRLVRLLNNPKDTTFSEIHTILNNFGYRLSRIKGSHFTFKKPKSETVVIPVHNNKVKKTYIKKIIKILYESTKL